jgi:catechol 2,3-dioxygenase-like lactoylglutathione lyase family enzyme
VSDQDRDPTQWNFMNPVFEVSDVAAAHEYYRDVLGLSPTWTYQRRAGGLTIGSLELYLARSDEPRPSHVAVFVDDADAAHARYRAAGAEIVKELATHPWGTRGFTVRDPDGNLIDVAHEVGPNGRREGGA